MPFETFKRNRMPSTQEPAVTIQKRGALSFNTAAYEALGSPKHVVLLYDRENKLVAIRKASTATPHAYVVRGVGNKPCDPRRVWQSVFALLRHPARFGPSLDRHDAGRHAGHRPQAAGDRG